MSATAAAELLVPAIRWHDDGTGYAAEREGIERALELGVGGVMLFGGPVAAVRELTAELRERSRIPLLVAADMERGAGQQFSGATGLPPLAALGSLGDLDAVRRAARLTAQEARDLGINWCCAPVCDLDLEPQNPIIGTRAFGADPGLVFEQVAEWIDGCQAEGVLACAKHFPGHGRTRSDSHAGLPVVTASANELHSIDLAPFRTAIDAGVASVMTAHVSYPSLDASGAAATLSSPILHDLLRTRLGFDGLVVTDALIMEGVLASGSEAQASVAALAAGCDLLLYPGDLSGVERALTQAVRAGQLDPEALRAATRRRARWADWAAVGVRGTAPTETDTEWAAIDAERCIHLVRGARTFPLGAATDVAIVDDDLGGPYPAPSREPFVRALGAFGARVQTVEALSPDLHSPLVIALFGDVRAWKGRPGYSSAALARVAALCEQATMQARDALVVQFSHPRHASAIPPCAAVVCAWGGDAAMQEAAARWLLRAR